jgi:hypothetical protein
MATKNKINKDVKQAEKALREALGNAFSQGYQQGGEVIAQTILPQLENIEAQCAAVREAIKAAKNTKELEITIEKAHEAHERGETEHVQPLDESPFQEA